MNSFASRCALSAVMSTFMMTALSSAQKSTSWDTYVNNRFTYVVDYPASLLKPQREAANADGREFRARQGTAKIAVWGSYVNNGNLSAKEQAELTVKDCAGGKTPYRLDKASVQAVSCLTSESKVLYYKSRQRKDILVSVEAHYPQAEKATWDPVIARMAKTLFVGESDDN